MNEYGDIYLQREKLAVGQKVYDQIKEMAYIKTSPWEHLIPIENEKFDNTLPYVKRSNRNEWVRVNLLGKVIVADDGKCQSGDYCKIYTGKLEAKQGTVVPAKDTDDVKKYYVIRRVSEKTILILNK